MEQPPAPDPGPSSVDPAGPESASASPGHGEAGRGGSGDVGSERVGSGGAGSGALEPGATDSSEGRGSGVADSSRRAQSGGALSASLGVGDAGVLASPPAGAAEVFGDRLETAVRYAELLATAGVERGLLGPREVHRLWDRHLLNSAVLGELLQPGEVVYDVGSGAGLPGIPLAIACQDVQIVLIEPLKRRAEFLDEAVALLDLPNVTVRRGRAEELPRPASDRAEPGPEGEHRRPDVVTARAVAPMARLAAWCLPLLAADGRLLALKGASAADELREAQRDLVRLGADRWDVVSLGSAVLEHPATVVRVWRSARPTDPRAVQQVLRRSRDSAHSGATPARESSAGPRGGRGAGRSARSNADSRRQSPRIRNARGTSSDPGVNPSSPDTPPPPRRGAKVRGRPDDRGRNA